MGSSSWHTPRWVASNLGYEGLLGQAFLGLQTDQDDGSQSHHAFMAQTTALKATGGLPVLKGACPKLIP